MPLNYNEAAETHIEQFSYHWVIPTILQVLTSLFFYTWGTFATVAQQNLRLWLVIDASASLLCVTLLTIKRPTSSIAQLAYSVLLCNVPAFWFLALLCAFVNPPLYGCVAEPADPNDSAVLGQSAAMASVLVSAGIATAAICGTWFRVARYSAQPHPQDDWFRSAGTACRLVAIVLAIGSVLCTYICLNAIAAPNCYWLRFDEDNNVLYYDTQFCSATQNTLDCDDLQCAYFACTAARLNNGTQTQQCRLGNDLVSFRDSLIGRNLGVRQAVILLGYILAPMGMALLLAIQVEQSYVGHDFSAQMQDPATAQGQHHSDTANQLLHQIDTLLQNTPTSNDYHELKLHAGQTIRQRTPCGPLHKWLHGSHAQDLLHNTANILAKSQQLHSAKEHASRSAVLKLQGFLVIRLSGLVAASILINTIVQINWDTVLQDCPLLNTQLHNLQPVMIVMAIIEFAQWSFFFAPWILGCLG